MLDEFKHISLIMCAVGQNLQIFLYPLYANHHIYPTIIINTISYREYVVNQIIIQKF
jgi:hypothetical protein